MQPTFTKIRPFTVAGISVRTRNSDEMNSETSKLSELWDRFFTENVAAHIDEQDDDSPIYGVYSDYESDVNGEYTTTAGVRLASAGPTSNGHAYVEIPGGDYLVFERTGPMPDTVWQTWNDVWQYFAAPGEYERGFTADYEEFTGADGDGVRVSVHVGVRPRH